MPKKKKQGVMLIAQSFGSENNCSKCGSPSVSLVVHDNIKVIELGDYHLSREEKKAIFNSFLKQCNEVFLCRKCYESDYEMNLEYVDDTGQYQYTTVPIGDWGKIEYMGVGEAVKKFS